jgi:hypothetical protein
MADITRLDPRIVEIRRTDIPNDQAIGTVLAWEAFPGATSYRIFCNTEDVAVVSGNRTTYSFPRPPFPADTWTVVAWKDGEFPGPLTALPQTPRRAVEPRGFALRLPPERFAEMRQRAEARGLSTNEWVNRAVQHALDHNGIGPEPLTPRLSWSDLL